MESDEEITIDTAMADRAPILPWEWRKARRRQSLEDRMDEKAFGSGFPFLAGSLSQKILNRKGGGSCRGGGWEKFLKIAPRAWLVEEDSI